MFNILYADVYSIMLTFIVKRQIVNHKPMIILFIQKKLSLWCSLSFTTNSYCSHLKYWNNIGTYIVYTYINLSINTMLYSTIQQNLYLNINQNTKSKFNLKQNNPEIETPETIPVPIFEFDHVLYSHYLIFIGIEKIS